MNIPAPEHADISIYKLYTAETTPASKAGSWDKVNVKVYKNVGDEKTLVYEYHRNYSMLKTFEPFRQWDGESWHYYALISPSYISFEVLDLESGEVVAKRAPTTYTIKREAQIQYVEEAKSKKIGDTFERDRGFCPMNFYVYDVFEAMREDDDSKTGLVSSWIDEDWAQSELRHNHGQYGFVGGCVWGDDSSEKLEYLDLTTIGSGLVAQDDRFGYWELPEHGELKDHIQIDDDYCRISGSMSVDLKAGTVNKYHRDNINWSK